MSGTSNPAVYSAKPLSRRLTGWLEYPKGTKHLLDEMGPEAFCSWVKEQKHILYTDTTFRDAHTVSAGYPGAHPGPAGGGRGFRQGAPRNCFPWNCGVGRLSIVAMRFLRECPWNRLQQLREAIPKYPVSDVVSGFPMRWATKLTRII